MKKHYNLYYLFLEDKRNNPMPEKRRVEIRKVIEQFYNAIRPPENGRKLLKKNN